MQVLRRPGGAADGQLLCSSSSQQPRAAGSTSLPIFTLTLFLCIGCKRNELRVGGGGGVARTVGGGAGPKLNGDVPAVGQRWRTLCHVRYQWRYACDNKWAAAEVHCAAPNGGKLHGLPGTPGERSPGVRHLAPCHAPLPAPWTQPVSPLRHAAVGLLHGVVVVEGHGAGLQPAGALRVQGGTARRTSY